MNKYIDYDYIMANNKSIRYFGLGFIQVDMTNGTRLHFYHEGIDATALEDEVHDHKYDFESIVLAGSLQNTIYQFEENHDSGTHMSRDCCQVDGAVDGPTNKGNLIELYSAIYSKGTKYRMQKNTLHKVSSKFAITELHRDLHSDKQAAKVYTPVEMLDDVTCAYASYMTDDEAKEWIARCLDEARELGTKIKNPGYHITPIPKGVIGEVTKILEESLELLDAVDQKCTIMQLVEASDIYGALESFVEQKHSGVSMGDIVKMSNITKRAFKNGHR